MPLFFKCPEHGFLNFLMFTQIQLEHICRIHLGLNTVVTMQNLTAFAGLELIRALHLCAQKSEGELVNGRSDIRASLKNLPVSVQAARSFTQWGNS